MYRLLVLFSFIAALEASVEYAVRQQALYVVGPKVRCSSVIISPRHALTAAHCVGTTLNQESFLFAGSSNLEKDAVQKKVVRTLIHEKYSSSPRNHNIAILYIDPNDPFILNEKIVKAVLPSPKDEFQHIATDVGVCGWNIDNGFSRILKVSVARLVPQNQCDEIKSDDTNLICVKSNERGSCVADSGSPLFIRGSLLIGLASHGLNRLCTSDRPAIYTDIAKMRQWISKNTGV